MVCGRIPIPGFAGTDRRALPDARDRAWLCQDSFLPESQA